MNPDRSLAARFLDLPHSLRDQVARQLGLIAPGDSSLSDGERYAAWIGRARERGILARLWDAIDLVNPAGPSVEPNPFDHLKNS